MTGKGRDRFLDGGDFCHYTAKRTMLYFDLVTSHLVIKNVAVSAAFKANLTPDPNKSRTKKMNKNKNCPLEDNYIHMYIMQILIRLLDILATPMHA